MNELPVIDGYLPVPEEPGAGFSPDWDWLERRARAIV
jgi:L-alanine-DL-glutamate epimerase-like enolase superfamily enzyme